MYGPPPVLPPAPHYDLYARPDPYGSGHADPQRYAPREGER